MLSTALNKLHIHLSLNCGLHRACLRVCERYSSNLKCFCILKGEQTSVTPCSLHSHMSPRPEAVILG